MKSVVFIFFLMCAITAFGQQKVDSLQINQKIKSTSGKVDSLFRNQKADTLRRLSGKISGKLDSVNVIDARSQEKVNAITNAFHRRADSLQLTYKKPIDKLDSISKGLQHHADILNKMNIPSGKVTGKLDSVNQLKQRKIGELNSKMDKLKSKATHSLDSIKLPGEMNTQLQKYKQSINAHSIPVVDGKIPGLDVSSAKLSMGGMANGGGLSGLGKTGVPSLGNTSPGQLGVPALNGSNPLSNATGDVSKLTGQAGQYGKDLKSVTSGNIPDGLDKKAEGEIGKRAPMGDLTGKNAELEKYKSQFTGQPDSAALGMVKQEAIKQATNHFAGKEAMLKEAMDKMSKLKTRYSDVKSMADLPKKLPNPLHDKPFIERVIPFLTFQIIGTQPFMLDANAGAMYRISPRLSAGAGYVYRVSFDNNILRDINVYGPRVNTQFMIGKGFSARFSPELLNTFVPPQYYLGVTDAGKREWVWSALVGLKKDFKVYKSIRGNTEALYNVYNLDNKSPYRDQLVVRLGFEFPMKKKKSKD